MLYLTKKATEHTFIADTNQWGSVIKLKHCGVLLRGMHLLASYSPSTPSIGRAILPIFFCILKWRKNMNSTKVAANKAPPLTPAQARFNALKDISDRAANALKEEFKLKHADDVEWLKQSLKKLDQPK